MPLSIIGTQEKNINYIERTNQYEKERATNNENHICISIRYNWYYRLLY